MENRVLQKYTKLALMMGSGGVWIQVELDLGKQRTVRFLRSKCRGDLRPVSKQAPQKGTRLLGSWGP